MADTNTSTTNNTARTYADNAVLQFATAISAAKGRGEQLDPQVTTFYNWAVAYAKKTNSADYIARQLAFHRGEGTDKNGKTLKELHGIKGFYARRRVDANTADADFN